jgi:hypothetical protein
MTRNGVRCRIVGVHRDVAGSIDHVTVEHLESRAGVASLSLAQADPMDLAVENSKDEVFDAVFSIEGVVKDGTDFAGAQAGVHGAPY